MNLVNYQDSRPIYEQIVENFKIQILKGVLQEGDQMPSVRSLAMELSANPNTIQKAYIELERQGFIYTVKGKGNYVKTDVSLKQIKKDEIISKVQSLINEAMEIGFTKEEIFEKITDGGVNI
ncbi:MAG: GntR family transcriptional regulator [Butyrivibrio sp.]|nr:GntR family transcriptional regulator [Butyrivibrio sp.]